jgi:hypothetical protein
LSRIEQAEAEAEAYEELSGSWKADEEQDLEIERKLVDLKARVKARL